MSRNKLSAVAGMVLIIVLLTACSDTGRNNFVTKHGALSVKGTNIVDQHGEIVTLHGVTLGWHNWWPRFYDRQTVAWLKKDWHIKVIRAAIGAEPENAYITNPDFALKCLTTVVDAAIENDIYVIIDWHSHNIRLEEAKAFFTFAAGKYKNYPNIIYELMNEPDYETWDEVKTYSEELIRHIRAIDEDNIILVGSPHWNQDIHIVAANPIKGYDNIMYTMHFYAGMHQQDLRDRANEALGTGLPIFVSECAGMDATGDGNIDYQEWGAWKQWMDEHQIGWTAWYITDKEEIGSMVKSQDSPVSDWKDSDLKEWGVIIRNILKKYR